MYVCQICQKVTPPHTPSNRIITETRPRRYLRRSKANRVPGIRKSRRKDDDSRKDDPGGDGYEIVREIIVCPACVQREQIAYPQP
jgi:hypothetical protein